MIQKYRGIVPLIDRTSYMAPGSLIIGKVVIGKNSSVWHNAVIRGDMAEISIGEGSNIQDGCQLHCTEDIRLVVGNGVTVGHGAILHSCEIGDDSLIGMGSIILDKTRIGKNCLIGAGAVITPGTVIPDGYMALGNPAKVKRELTGEEIAAIRANSAEYSRLAEEYRNQDVEESGK